MKLPVWSVDSHSPSPFTPCNRPKATAFLASIHQLMKVSPIRFAASAALFIIVSFDSISLAQSADRLVISAENPDIIAGVPVRVLDGVELKYPDHSVIYRRIAPPALPATLNVPKSAAVADASVEQLKARTQAEKRERKTIFLSATVYDHSVTELRWSDEKGSHHAYSNIDFNYLVGVSHFETKDSVYNLIMSIGNETRENLYERNQRAVARGMSQSLQKSPPDPAQFPQDRSSYLVTPKKSAADTSNVFPALDALHAYYDANSAQLQQASQDREAKRVANEQWQKEHPPGPPPDTVINFWPIKSTNYNAKGVQEK